MGSSSKKYKEKESRKRKHHEEEQEAAREKRHKHKRHHRDKKKEKGAKYAYGEKRQDYKSDDSDVVEIIEQPPESPVERPARTSEESTHGQGALSLSVDETNKLRAKLGLRPLDVQSQTVVSGAIGDNKKRKDDLGEFYHVPAENLQQKAQQAKMKNKLAEMRERRVLSSKYGKVKGLGESDSEEDTGIWIDKSRRIEQAKREAERRAKELEELDAQFGVGDVVESELRAKLRQQYTEKDLKGLTVQHDLNSFADERNVVLTLKDKGVLEEDDDVLVNVNMVDDERYKKNVENKTKKLRYNAYEDDEFDEFGNPLERSLLNKYDEEIEGQKKTSFKIGYDNLEGRKQTVAESVKAKLAQKRLESIPEKQLVVASEYYNEEELAKFKKPKNKKNRKMRSKGKLLTADELKPDNVGIEAIGSRRPKVKNETDYNIDDVPDVELPSDLKMEEEKDDLLERALHKARKIQQKENIIAEIIKSELKSEPEEENPDNANIVLNATAEFCRTLGDIPTYGKAGNREETEEIIDFEKDILQENSDEDCEIIEPTGWNSIDPTNQGVDPTQSAPSGARILDEEPDVSTGVGAALKLAMSKGYLDKEQKNRLSNSRLAHLQAQHYSIEDKSYGDDGGDRGGRRERYSGPIMDFKEKETFKPNVKLEYIDDDGRVLNSKEAFRYLSHKFHGKGPGKNKVEKRIKKQQQEQLMKKMSSTDTPLGTLNMLQAKQKETQSAFVVLSGNKQAQSTSLSKTRR